MKVLTRLLLSSLIAASASACQARSLVDMSIVDRDTGGTLPTYYNHGHRYVPGEAGHRYAVHLANRTGERVMVVLSVDGVNAVTGQTAAASQTGYVLGPWQSADIDGWRKSDDDVASFVFTSLPDSYAARTGRPDNVGVIGMAVFREKLREPVYAPSPDIAPYDSYSGNATGQREMARRDQAAPTAAGRIAAKSSDAPMAQAMEGSADASRQVLGTGHGERQYSPISRTSFERMSSTPQQVTQLWYDTPQQLAARGIIPRWYPRPPQPSQPQAFPVGYVPDPPSNW